MGGNNNISMVKLKGSFEDLGLKDVKTYINSGNIIFTTNVTSQKELTERIEDVIEQDFGLSIKVVLRSLASIRTIIEALPPEWVNDKTMKCDVMFLWEAVDSPAVLKQLVNKPEIEDLKYVPGAIMWRVDRQHVNRSALQKLAGTPLYKQVTIRNCNTARKLYALMQNVDSQIS